MHAPLPEDSEPKISVFSLPVGPAPSVPRPMGAGHTHAGPVFAYILRGEIENQVEPDPPRTYKPGEFFYETPGHIHRFLRNLSTTDPARLIIFEAGYTGPAAPVIKLLLEETLPSTVNQELSLLRRTLPPRGSSESGAYSGPGVIYILDGKIETSGVGQSKIYSVGDLFPVSADAAGLTFRNTSGSAPAQLLLYQVSGKRAP
ncbi:MAG TPA: cupin domain-containing protein [Bryobacteraceae bacterium]